jgi:hypothetical protein
MFIGGMQASKKIDILLYLLDLFVPHTQTIARPDLPSQSFFRGKRPGSIA